jgi:NhaP-type Na+/H+ or K+/H+ antiporter
MIFAGGYNLKKKKFFQNFIYIALFGVLGTFVCFGIMFGLTYLINHLGIITVLLSGYIRNASNFD